MDMDAVEDVKPFIRPHNIFDVQQTRTEMLPMKMGEIFRNNKEQYSFMCFHCCLIFEDFDKIISHCESHYQDEKYDVNVEPSEVVRAEMEGESVIPLDQPLPDVDMIDPIVTPNFSEISVEHFKRKRGRKRKHPEEEPNRNLEKKPEPDTPQNCPICEVWYEDYRGHMKKVHNLTSRVFQCYMCRKFFKSDKSLISHMSSWNHTTNHCYQCEMEPPIKHPSEPRRHRCQFCKEWFPNHVEVKTHFRDAHNEDADFFFHKRKNCNCFTCYVCEREFPLRCYLAAHMRVHYDKFRLHFLTFQQQNQLLLYSIGFVSDIRHFD